MLTTGYISGNLLFEDSGSFPATAVIRFEILNKATLESIYKDTIDFDTESLALFKYLPFELKSLEIDPAATYLLKVHLDMTNDGNLKSGDFINKNPCIITTGLEEFDISLIRY